MKLRIACVAAVVVIAGVVVWRTQHRPASTPPISPLAQKQEGVVGAVPAASSPSTASTIADGTTATTPAASTQESPGAILTEMETVKFFLRDFRAALGENPVGNNAEIAKALMGANAKKSKFVLPGDSHLNASGELVDAWGTPYFFHALSAREMEIHSAGPDKQMWTSDDIVMR
jgi:hypothetical protein